MLTGVSAVPVSMVGAVIGMALRRRSLLIAIILMLPVGMLLRRALTLPLRFLLLLVLAAIAVILFGALTLGMSLLIEVALVALLLLALTLMQRLLLLPLLPLLICLPLLLLSLLLGLLIAMPLLPLTLPLLMRALLPNMLVTLACRRLFLLAWLTLLLVLGWTLLRGALLHMLVARALSTVVLLSLRLGALAFGTICLPLPARTALLPMAGCVCRHGKAKAKRQGETQPGGPFVIPHSCRSRWKPVSPYTSFHPRS
jgi:hypothetical protein